MTWHFESRRHALASKGIKTARKVVVVPENVMERLRKDPQFSESILSKPARLTKRNKFEIIGEKKGLSGRKLSDYVDFMQERFPRENPNVNESFSNSTEWAERFRDGKEWALGDKKSREALIKANPLKYSQYNKGVVTFKGRQWEIISSEDGEYTLSDGQGRTEYARKEELQY